MSGKESLISYMLPLETKINIVPVNPFIKEDNKHYKSFLLLGPKQIQKTGLLFQAALTNSSLGKSVVYVAPKQLSRLPVSVHGLPHPVAENMELIEFLYLENGESLVQYLAKIHTKTAAAQPDVLVIENLQHYAEHFPDLLTGLLQLSALLTSALNFIGSQKGTFTQLYVGCDLGDISEELHHAFKNKLCLSYEEAWCLVGHSNVLIHEDIEIRFTVSKPFIFLSKVIRVS